MKIVKRLAWAFGLSAMVMGAAQADTVINNWAFNPNGTGFATATTINENLDVVGGAFIDLTPGQGSNFTFTESAVFKVAQHDQGLSLPTPNYITATFQASGAGIFGTGFAFSTGQVKFYSDPVDNYGGTTDYYGAAGGTLIATFDVLPGGGGAVDGSGNPIANGEITVYLKAATPGGILPGYFFGPSGVDLSTTDVLAFAFTNANPLQSPSVTFVDEVACQFAGFTGGTPGLCPFSAGNTTPTSVPGDYIFVGNNGQFKLTTVPEPSSMALLGLSLLALGAVSHRDNKRA